MADIHFLSVPIELRRRFINFPPRVDPIFIAEFIDKAVKMVHDVLLMVDI